LELKAEYSAAHHNLGDAYRDQGQIEDSIACYRRALALKSASVESMVNLGEVFRRRGMLGEAAASATRALELNPGLAEAHNNLGSAFKDQGNIVEAEACFHRALELKPGLAEAHDNLGLVYRDQGKLDQALAAFRRALELKPGSPGTHSNLLFAQILHPGFDAAALYEEHLQWNQRHAAPLAKLAELHRRDRAPDRRLRIGYVSPAFCHHVVGRNLLPLFREHDHRQLEIFCYSDAPRPDELTDQFRRDADVWRECAGRPDEKLAEWIRHDQIDIMVDLSVHSDGNRLLLFARRPAPLQVTFAGYPGTTGLSAIDYRLTDPYLDPPGLFDHFYSEQSIRLPDSFWCYDPQESDPSVNGLPAAEKRYITFGCLNNFCKVNPVVLALWAQVLRAVEGSQLIVLAGQGRHREDTLRLLEAEGVDRRRVTFTARRPRSQYLSCYHEIDIGLDTVPYNGHTTSLDSFWMGVPIVTLVGSTVVGRAGLSQLTNLGLQELIATSPEKYVQIAATLAQDRPRISALRSTLRERMEASPLMDAPRFARGIEAAYRQIWREWCAA
jgi:predicted O-linked N-acetylglucosamine transferase (SPINDLY family)